MCPALRLGTARRRIARASRANRARLRLFAALLGMFMAGGMVGAAGFKYIGFGWVVPFAVILLGMSLPPLLSDLRHYGRREPYRAALPPSTPPRLP